MKQFSQTITLLIFFVLFFALVCSVSGQDGWITVQNDLPQSYLSPADQQGIVEELRYSTPEGEKIALIYLPYGYGSSTEPYDIFYFMHGGGGSPYLYFTPEGTSPLSNMLDHMIRDRLIRPIIMVAPTFYSPDDNDFSVSNAGALVERFPEELTSALMAAVESKYRTFAAEPTSEGFKASRDHRAFGGFSMGSVTTWYVFLNDLEYFRYFVPLSGDCWVIRQMGGGSASDETADALARAVSEQGFAAEDFMIYALTGTNDIAYDTLTAQMNTISSRDVFRYGENTFYGLLSGGTHNHPEMRQYIFTALQLFWSSK